MVSTLSILRLSDVSDDCGDGMKWHTAQEKRVIRKYGGKPLKKYGTDGTIRGKPVEVRSVRKDDRYRIQRNTHKELVAKRGSYIFCDKSKTKRVAAGRVSALLSNGKWLKDRKYPHKFLKKDQVFGR